MAANIFHGAPGSFKSASLLWFEILPALRAGRVVVTNLEGILTKESIEIELGEEFPESADIWRLSSQTDEGLYLWRRWFWWVPIGAFIVIDEVQDVYPADSTVIKPNDFNSKGIQDLVHKLPKKYYDYHFEKLREFKPDISESTIDDTGELVLDSNGYVIYPQNMREANMRHRKYNWDIVYGTPEITEIHKLVRSVCQYAYKFKYFDSIDFIPYFYRRPRMAEHSPKLTGESISKDNRKIWRKVPLDVHKMYKSTSTNKITTRRGANPFKSPTFVLSFALLFFAICYFGYYFLIKDDKRETQKLLEETSALHSENTKKNNFVSSDTYNNKAHSRNAVSLELPFDATAIYLTGVQKLYMKKSIVDVQYFFDLEIDSEMYSINSDLLKNKGYLFKYVNDCLVVIKKQNTEKLISCKPSKSMPNLPQARESEV